VRFFSCRGYPWPRKVSKQEEPRSSGHVEPAEARGSQRRRLRPGPGGGTGAAQARCSQWGRLRPGPGCGAGAAETCGSQRRRLRPGPGGGPEEVSCRRPSRERRAEKKNALLPLLSEVAVKKCGRSRVSRCRGAAFRSSFFPSNLSLRSQSQVTMYDAQLQRRETFLRRKSISPFFREHVFIKCKVNL